MARGRFAEEFRTEAVRQGVFNRFTIQFEERMTPV